MRKELFYFSGTGNTLHVARELKKRLPELTLLPIIHCLRSNLFQTHSETVGFAFPNFCMTIPIPVHDFLQQADLRSATYIFAVCTRGGSPSKAFEFMNTLLKKQGKCLHAQININMPWNHPLGKEDLPSIYNKESSIKCEVELQQKLDELSTHISDRKIFIKPDTDVLYPVPSWIITLTRLTTKTFHYRSHAYMYQKRIHFYADSKCNGCGVCEKVCLGDKIEMHNQKPDWQTERKCLGCFACINYCPQQAIQVESRFPITSYTKANGRYHHEAVTYQDIAEQH